MEQVWEIIRQHKLYRLAAGYAMASWLFAQAASIVLPAFDAPAWAMRLIIVVAILGLPTTLAAGWLTTTQGAVAGQYGTYGILGLLGTVILFSSTELLWQWPVALPASPALHRPDASSSAALAAQTGRVVVTRFEVRQPSVALQGFAANLADSMIRSLSRAAIDTVPEVVERGAATSVTAAEMRVTGSVEPDGDDIVVNVQVTDIRTGLILNSAEIRRRASSLPGFADEVGRDIAGPLDCALEDRRQSRRVIEPHIFALYLNACDAYVREDNMQRALEALQRLVKAAPDLSVGQAMYAILLIQTGHYGNRSATEAVALIANGRKAAELALQLDPNTPKAYLALALSYPDDSHWLERFQYLQKARQIDPNLGPALLPYLRLLHAAGRVKEFLQVTEQVKDSPDARTSGGAQTPIAVSLAQSGDINGAKEILRQLQRTSPDEATYLQWQIISMWENPVTGLKELQTLDTRHIDPLSVSCMKAFLPRLATGSATHVRGLPKECDGVSTYRRILMLIREGDIDGAYAAIPNASDLSSSFLAYLYGADTRPFWSDPRFMTLASRFGLPEYWIASNHWPDFCNEPGPPYDCRKVARATLSKLVMGRAQGEPIHH